MQCVRCSGDLFRIRFVARPKSWMPMEVCRCLRCGENVRPVKEAALPDPLEFPPPEDRDEVVLEAINHERYEQSLLFDTTDGIYFK